MAYTDEQIRMIYDKTAGHCHLCGKVLSLKNYGQRGSRGAWAVDHSTAKARGGSGYLRNLFAACNECHDAKGTSSSGPIRRGNGVRLRKRGAPPSHPGEGFLGKLWNDLKYS